MRQWQLASILREGIIAKTTTLLWEKRKDDQAKTSLFVLLQPKLSSSMKMREEMNDFHFDQGLNTKVQYELMNPECDLLPRHIDLIIWAFKDFNAWRLLSNDVTRTGNFLIGWTSFCCQRVHLMICRELWLWQIQDQIRRSVVKRLD